MAGHFTRAEVLRVLPALLEAASELITDPARADSIRAAGTSEDRVMAILNAHQTARIVAAGFPAERFSDVETIYSDFKDDREVMSLLAAVVQAEEALITFAETGKLPEHTCQGCQHGCQHGGQGCQQGGNYGPSGPGRQAPGSDSSPCPKSMSMNP
eukprot:m51a1_g8158 hypothetical protein (156) ;mRNA; f:64956-65588